METPHTSASSEPVAPTSTSDARQEYSQQELERIRLCCGIVRLLLEQTDCTLAEAARYLGETEDIIVEWQRILQEHNAPPPGLADINSFCLSLPVSQRGKIMTRLSARKTAQRPQQSQEQQRSSRRPPILHEEQRVICAMTQYLRSKWGLLQKDAAEAFDVAQSALSLWSKRVEEDDGQTIPPEETLLLLAKRLGSDRLTDLAEKSPRVRRMRGEEIQKPPSLRTEYIEGDWRRICAMVELLRTQFAYTVSQAARILKVGLPNYYAWLRKISRDGGHGITPEEAYLLLDKRLNTARLMDLALNCPAVRKKMVCARQPVERQEPYFREEAEWQLFLAVEILLDIPGIDLSLACSSLNVSEAVYEQYRQKFLHREQTADDRRRAASLIVDLFEGELPKTQEEIRKHLEELNEQKPDSRFFRNVLEAIRMGDGHTFVGRASNGYVPTDAMPGSHEKHDVILGRIDRGDPSGFHPGDRCAYLDVKRADFIRLAIAEGMEK